MKAIFKVRSDDNQRHCHEQRFLFSKRYLGLVEQTVGDWIIYQQPRLARGKIALSEAGYFATARVAGIHPADQEANSYWALFDDYLQFPEPVAFSDVQPREGLRSVYRVYRESDMRESDGSLNASLAQKSVRLIQPHEYDALLTAGFGTLGISTDDLSVRAGETAGGALTGFEEPLPTRSRRPVTENRYVRDIAFQQMVNRTYGHRCAFTGLQIKANPSSYECDAVHCIPVKSNGPDSIRNGFSLSKTIHWMFDYGLLSLSDDYAVLVRREGIPREIERLLNPGRLMALPDETSVRPHPRFVRWHRENIFQG